MSRLDEFVNYHINGDCECNGQVLAEYAKYYGLSEQDKLDLIFFYTMTYAVVSAVQLLKIRPLLRSGANLATIKKTLIFQSDRKYVKYIDRFEKLIQLWKQKFDGNSTNMRNTIESGGKIKATAIKECEKWYFFGRFTTYLFLETYCALFGTKCEAGLINVAQYSDGDTYTAGIYNVFGYDEKANEINKYGANKEDEPEIDEMQRKIIQAIHKAGGSTSVFDVETTLCAYRKHFKGTRYNGFYADRQLAELVEAEKLGMQTAAKEVYLMRKRAINKKYLGEINGWTGIRTELKKHYLMTGKVYNL